MQETTHSDGMLSGSQANNTNSLSDVVTAIRLRSIDYTIRQQFSYLYELYIDINQPSI